MEEFNKEKFINHCCFGCNGFRRTMLEKIEQYRELEPEIVKALMYYRDYLWNAQVKAEDFRALHSSIGENKLREDSVTALRAMADQIESGDFALILNAELPEIPIFSGKDKSFTNIEITLAKHYIGG